MSDLMEDFFDTEFYDSAIEKSLDKQISAAQIRKFCTVAFRLKLLQDLEEGKYKIAPPHVSYIPKDDGTLREIYVNSAKDRMILTLINAIWYKRHADMISPACKAYISGSSCAKVVREVATKHISGYKLDLSKYFDSVSHEIINKYLAELDTGTPLDKAVYAYYNDDTVIVKGERISRFKSLAQGCAVSAFLSNCVLEDIDDKMLELCEYYCRYSDDMLLLGKGADKALTVLQSMLCDKGLSLNSNKIEQVSADKEFKFLGFGIHGGVIDISQKDYCAKKAEIKHVTRVVMHKRMSAEDKLRTAVKEVMSVFNNWAEPTHGWLYVKAQGINSTARLAELDKYCKEHIRAAVTGGWNFTTNMNKVSEEKLREAGYVSLLHIFKIATMDRSLFLQECLQWKQHMR